MSAHGKTPQVVSSQYPVPTKIPVAVLIAAFFGFGVIVAILYAVGATAAQGHIWPAGDSLKLPLK